MSEYTPNDPSLAERFTNALNVGPSPERAEMRRMGAAMRRVIERLVNSKAPVDELREAADMLDDIAHSMEKHPQGRMYEFAESANAGAPLAFFDHSPVMGVSNPLAPPPCPSPPTTTSGPTSSPTSPRPASPSSANSA